MKEGLVVILAILLAAGMIFLKIHFNTQNKQLPTLNPPKEPVREPAVAEAFYEKDPRLLEEHLEKLLEKAPSLPLEKPRILIVPHAGLKFSGRTAAMAYKQIQGKNYERVIIIAQSHNFHFKEAALYAKGSFETPLGISLIDEEFAQALLSPENGVIENPSYHAPEHTTEMQVIFLQKLLPKAKIVPILLSNPSERLLDYLAFRLRYLMDEKTLVVVSADLSHYPDSQTAKEVDELTIKAILKGEAKELEETYNRIKASHPELATPTCSLDALKLGLKLAKLLGVKFQKIFYENSGDVTGEKNRVVGYPAIIAASNKLLPFKPSLTEEAEKEALEIAKQALTEFVLKGKKIQPKPASSELYLPIPVFITLKKDGALRGCLGVFDTKVPLYKTIVERTIASASKDPRFEPVRPEELDKISLEISLLGPITKISDWRKIKLGEDGVLIKLGGRGGTFLPEVAEDTGWDLETFLSNLCTQKAGLPPDCYKYPETEIYIYKTSKIEKK